MQSKSDISLFISFSSISFLRFLLSFLVWNNQQLIGHTQSSIHHHHSVSIVIYSISFYWSILSFRPLVFDHTNEWNGVKVLFSPLLALPGWERRRIRIFLPFPLRVSIPFTLEWDDPPERLPCAKHLKMENGLIDFIPQKSVIFPVYLSRRGIEVSKYKPSIKFNPDKIQLIPKNPVIPGCVKIKAEGQPIHLPFILNIYVPHLFRCRVQQNKNEVQWGRLRWGKRKMNQSDISGVEILRPVKNLVAEIEMRIGGSPDPNNPTLPCSKKIDERVNQCPCARVDNAWYVIYSSLGEWRISLFIRRGSNCCEGLLNEEISDRPIHLFLGKLRSFIRFSDFFIRTTIFDTIH